MKWLQFSTPILKTRYSLLVCCWTE